MFSANNTKMMLLLTIKTDRSEQNSFKYGGFSFFFLQHENQFIMCILWRKREHAEWRGIFSIFFFFILQADCFIDMYSSCKDWWWFLYLFDINALTKIVKWFQ